MSTSVRGTLGRIREELTRDDLDPPTRALRVAELALIAARVAPAVAIVHERFYELTKAPPQFRGLRDLVVRRAGPADADTLAELETTRADVDRRLAAGDLAYVGELNGRVLAQAWFHPGPEPFDEDADLLARWSLDSDTFWSYAAYARPEARLSGVFVKVFQTALREIMTVHGGARVRCRVKAVNTPSVTLHERMGFHVIGEITALALPGMRILSWTGEGGARRWVYPRKKGNVMSLPPVKA